MTRVRAVTGVVILVFGLAASSAAQGTGDIVGRVADSSGGVLPGVTVTATSLSTNISRTTVTSETGVASPSAHGHAIMSTATALTRA